MSPIGRVNVAFAGITTRVWAVLFTVFEVAAKGRATTKKALPTMVATRQTGRTMTASATTMAGSALAAAKLEFVPARQNAARQTKVMNLFFIVSSIRPNLTHCPDKFNCKLGALLRAGVARDNTDS